VSDKIKVIDQLMGKVDALLIGGAMAYTFLSARGVAVGASRVEKDKIDVARRILEKAGQSRVEVMLPSDHVVAKEPKAGVATQTVAQIPEGMLGLDIGPVGVWIPSTRYEARRDEFQDSAAELEELGYGALWLGSADGGLQLPESLKIFA